MDMEAAVAGAAQGDLAEVVARAGAIMPAPLPSSSTLATAADHIPSSSAAAAMGIQQQQIMVAYDEEPARRPPSSDTVMMFDPYLPSSATAPRGGYWLPPQQQLALQISHHACYARDVDGNEAMRISPAAHQIMKSRKNEVKKVVCIPALPPTSSRPGGGEVIPSDLWAWRKYGQKPIKGSPYPRGYYRCSSSKGCMARKQVERSRSDPNMLVITYTAEHNHPWPMQRNVLAGYSRPHTHTSTNCKKKNSCRVGPITSSPPLPSKNVNYYQQTTDMMEGNEAGCVAYTIGDEEGVAMHQPMSCNSIQTADEVFAELEELEPSNTVSSNNYSRGVSYEWQKF
ncbi:unnamed protein product [Urochloa humidicola]